jgi:hypothetical protein
MPLFVVERILPMGTGTVQLDNEAKRLIASLEARPGMKWVRSLLATDRSKIFYQFEAPEANTCKEIFDKTGLISESITPVVELLPEMYLDDPDPNAVGPTGQTWS